jgi:mannose-6-phosphate isomerase-like protein (cupin superfamily)
VSGNAVVLADAVPFEKVEWGLSKVLAGASAVLPGVESDVVEFKITEYPPGYAHLGHVHPGQIEILWVLSGRGVHEDENGNRTDFGVGHLVYIPADSYHANHNPFDEPLRVVVVKVPPTR